MHKTSQSPLLMHPLIVRSQRALMKIHSSFKARTHICIHRHLINQLTFKIANGDQNNYKNNKKDNIYILIKKKIETINENSNRCFEMGTKMLNKMREKLSATCPN